VREAALGKSDFFSSIAQGVCQDLELRSGEPSCEREGEEEVGQKSNSFYRCARLMSNSSKSR
jgi:hypothetical protein